MCLYLCSQCSVQKCCNACASFWRSCCRECWQNCNPLGLLFNVLIGFPAGLFFVLGGGFVAALVNWLPGSYNHIVSLWNHVCRVIDKGRDAYSDNPNRRTGFCDCCAAVCAEVYCCMTPFFALATVFIPLWLLGLLLIEVFCEAFVGGCAGCVGTDVQSWWPCVASIARRVDYTLASDALRPEAAPILTCLGPDEPGRQRLPSAGPQGAPPLPVTGQPQYAQPAQPAQYAQYAQSAHVPPPPARSDPLDQMERAVATAARDVAAQVVFAGVRSFFGAGGAVQQTGGRPPPAQVQPPPAPPVAVPRAVPVAQPVAAGRMQPAVAVPVGRRVQ